MAQEKKEVLQKRAGDEERALWPGNPLYKFRGVVDACGRSGSVSTILCGSYITGFVQGSLVMHEAAVIDVVANEVIRGTVPPTEEAMDAAARKAREQSQPYCIKSDFTASYVQAVVGQYALEHPEALDDASADHMLKILAKAFPCGKPE